MNYAEKDNIPALVWRGWSQEALKAAGILGAETRIFPCSSGMLDISVKMKEELASIIEDIKPQAIITHWKNSIHPDHAAAHYNTIGAMSKAKMGKVPLFFSENWEDSTEFNPDIAVRLEQEDFNAWLKAAEAFQFFREGFYNYPYRQYYKNLFFNRGAITRNGPYASVLMRHKYQGEFIKTELPGTEA